MTHILLTGAGFTHNWGGWLSVEAFEYLLGAREIDHELREELWLDKNAGRGFEATLERLQQQAKSDPSGPKARQVEALMVALAGMFSLMDKGLARQNFEFQQDIAYQLGPFLTRFDAIFTLNQDLFLERKYFSGMSPLGVPGKWAGAYTPGIAPPAPATAFDPDHEFTARRSPMAPGNFLLHPHTQPYIKLHGSSNWYDDGGRGMLVMGGNKTVAIDANPLLAWYAEILDRLLQQGNTKLMVIGYGFGDKHINDAIIAGCRRGLKVFIVDPAGVDVIDHRLPPGSIGRALIDLMVDVQPNLIGGSRRPLRAIFGDDKVEHSRVMRFFDP